VIYIQYILDIYVATEFF